MDLAKARKRAQALKKERSGEERPRHAAAAPPVPEKPRAKPEARIPAAKAPAKAPVSPPSKPAAKPFPPKAAKAAGMAKPSPALSVIGPARRPLPTQPSAPPETITRDAREDPAFRDILRPTPREDEVLGLLGQADENPEFPKMDPPAPKPKSAVAKPEAPLGEGVYDAIWNDEQAKLLGLVEEELFRRTYGQDRSQEEAGEKYLGFALSGERYALGVTEVAEIIKFRPLISVPHSPPWIMGILSLRGAIIPVVDLRLRLGMPVPEAGHEARILILGGEGERMGLWVEKVVGVIKIPSHRVDPPPTLGAGIGGLATGIGRLPEGLYVLLDSSKLGLLAGSGETASEKGAP